MVNLPLGSAARSRWAVAAWVLALAHPARAEDARRPVTVRIDATADLPFTSAELSDAILLRVDRGELAVPVVLSIDRSGPEGRACLGVGQGHCDVAFDAEPGPSGVRTVALLAADLLESKAWLVPEPRASAPRRWVAGLEGLGAPAGGWGDGRFEGHLEVKRQIASRWWVTAAVGYGRVTRTAFEQSLIVDSVPVKAGLGLDLGWCDLRAATALRVQRAGAKSGVITGGWLEARPSLRTAAGRLALVVAIELATERLEVRPRSGSAVFTNGYATPWLGLALATP